MVFIKVRYLLSDMAYNSTIKRKKCKCGCSKFPTLGYNGYAMSCAPQEVKDRVGSKKKVAARNKSIRSEISRKLHKDQVAVGSAELNRWHEDRRKEATGVCVNCGGKSCRDSDDYFKFSNAHILPKAYFPSVKLHPLNNLELCYFGNGCHPQMDNKMLDLTEMNCWDEIVTKFVVIYPSIAANEKRRIPQCLLQYVEVE